MNVISFPAHTRPAQRIEGLIAALQRHIEHMAQVNCLLASENIEALKAMKYTDAQIAALQTPDSLGAIGFSERSFEDAEARIRQLRRGMTVPAITEAPGFDGRLQLKERE